MKHLEKTLLTLRKPLQFREDLVTFTEEILNGKLHFLCSVSGSTPVIKFHETCLSQVQNSYLKSHSWYV